MTKLSHLCNDWIGVLVASVIRTVIRGVEYLFTGCTILKRSQNVLLCSIADYNSIRSSNSVICLGISLALSNLTLAKEMCIRDSLCMKYTFNE